MKREAGKLMSIGEAAQCLKLSQTILQKRAVARPEAR
jgi:hypothetical protein